MGFKKDILKRLGEIEYRLSRVEYNGSDLAIEDHQLQPCPICKNKNVYLTKDDEFYWVQCDSVINGFNCIFGGPPRYFREEAIGWWNMLTTRDKTSDQSSLALHLLTEYKDKLLKRRKPTLPAIYLDEIMTDIEAIIRRIKREQ